MLLIIGQNVSVLLDLLVPDVKPMLMNVPVSHATMVVLVWTYLKVTDVTVLKDSAVSTVRRKSPTVIRTHALTGPCAAMNQDLATTLASADLVTLGKIVTLQWILVTATLAGMLLNVRAMNRADLFVDVPQAGRVSSVIRTLTTVLNNPAYWEPTAQI